MTKYIYLRFSNGERYCIEAKIIAHKRAVHYADKDHPEDSGKWDETYSSEYEYCLNDDYELVDWIRNSMDFHEFVFDLERVKGADHFSYKKDWNSDNVKVEVKNA